MGLGIFKQFSLLAISLLWASSALAVMDYRYAPPTTGLLKKWSNQTSLSEWIPTNPDLTWRTTHLSTTVSYAFDDMYSANLWAGIKNKWLEKNEREEGSKSYLAKDSALYLTRNDKITLHTSLYLPTSDYSKNAGRRFALSLEPVVKLYLTTALNVSFSSEITYYNNKYYTFENDPDQDFNDDYSISMKSVWTYKFNKTWSFGGSIKTEQSWCEEKTFDRTQEFNIGPDIVWDKNLSFSLTLSASDKIPNQRPLLHEDSTSLGLAMYWSL